MNFNEAFASVPINRRCPSGLKVNWSTWDYRTAKLDPHGTLEVSLTGVPGETYNSHFDLKWFRDKTVAGYTGTWKGRVRARIRWAMLMG